MTTERALADLARAPSLDLRPRPTVTIIRRKRDTEAWLVVMGMALLLGTFIGLAVSAS